MFIIATTMTNHARVICRLLLVAVSVATPAAVVSANTAAVVALSNIWQRVFAGLGEARPQDTSDNFQITLRDSVTGKRVQGQITFAAADGAFPAVGTDEAGRGGFRLAAGVNELQITAPGYARLYTHFDGGQSLDVTVWLDPQGVPVEMRPETIALRVQPRMTLIHGHVFDENGQPLPQARVCLEHAQTEAISDKTGYFRMSVPAPKVDPQGDLPGTDDLVVEYDGSVVAIRISSRRFRFQSQTVTVAGDVSSLDFVGLE